MDEIDSREAVRLRARNLVIEGPSRYASYGVRLSTYHTLARENKGQTCEGLVIGDRGNGSGVGEDMIIRFRLGSYL